jgi:uncharacterized MAPEG superfamily protein
MLVGFRYHEQKATRPNLEPDTLAQAMGRRAKVRRAVQEQRRTWTFIFWVINLEFGGLRSPSTCLLHFIYFIFRLSQLNAFDRRSFFGLFLYLVYC